MAGGDYRGQVRRPPHPQIFKIGKRGNGCQVNVCLIDDSNSPEMFKFCKITQTRNLPTTNAKLIQVLKTTERRKIGYRSSGYI